MKSSEFRSGVTPEALFEVSMLMRDSDKEEIWAAGHLQPFEALRMGARDSELLWTIFVEGRPAAIGGAAPADTRVPQLGVPWLLGTDRLKRQPVWFFRESRRKILEVQERFPLLVNFIDIRNLVSLRWLGWLGFRFSEPKPYGVERRLFREARLEARNVQ